MRWFRERIRGIIRRRSTKWWKRRGRKQIHAEKSRGVSDCCLPFMLEEQLPVWASLGRACPSSRVSSTYTQASMLMSTSPLLPNTALGVSVYPSPCTNRSSLPDTSHAVCFIRVVGLMLLLTCPACLNATWWCALIQVLNAHAWSLPSIPCPSLSSLLNLDTLVLNSMGGE